MAENKNIEVGGRFHSIATGNVIAGANEILDDAKGKKQSVINAENDVELASHESRLNAYTEGKFVTVSNYSALPATGVVDTVYRVSSWDGTANNGQGAVDVTKYSEYAWQNGAYKFLDVKTQIGEVFDISEYNSGAVYTDIANALGTNGINVPSFIRRGGMSVKFKQVITPATYTVEKTEGATEQPTGTELQSDPGIISGTYTAGELNVFSTLPATLNSSRTYYLAVTETVDEQEVTTYTTWVITYVQSSDNKYVQYRYMLEYANTTAGNQAFINPDNWQGVDSEIKSRSKNIVESGAVAESIGLPLSFYDKTRESVVRTVVGSVVLKAKHTYKAKVTRTSTNKSYIYLCSGNVSNQGTIYMDLAMNTNITERTAIYTPSQDITANIVVVGDNAIIDWHLVITEQNNNLLWTSEQPLSSEEKMQVLINLGIEEVANIDNRVSFVDSQIKTMLEKNQARANIDGVSTNGNTLGIDNNLTYFENVLVDTDINNDGTVISGSSCVEYRQVNKGDILTVVGHSDTGANTSSYIVLWYSDSKPVIGSTGLVKQLAKPIDGGITDVYVEWVAPADGWIIVRYFPRSTNYYILYKKDDYSSTINKYIPSTQVLSLIPSKAIDAAIDSLTFGEEKAIIGTSYGCTDYIDIEDASFIKLYQRYSTASFVANKDIFGSVFYDSGKNPISVATILVKTIKGYVKQAIVKVPANAKYIRMTEYIASGNYIIIYKTPIEETLKELKETDAVIDNNLVVINENCIKEDNFEAFGFINNRGISCAYTTDYHIDDTTKNYNYNLNYTYAKKGDVFKFEVMVTDDSELHFLLFNAPPTTINLVPEFIGTQVVTPADGTLAFQITVPKDGYFAVWTWRGTYSKLNVYKYNKYAEEASNLYIEKAITPAAYSTNVVIDTIPEHNTFGDAISLDTGSNYGCCDFIDINGAKYLKVLQRKSGADFTKSTNATFGSIFYDDNREPIAYSGTNIEYTTKNGNPVVASNMGWVYLKVPNNAKYFRLTGYVTGGNKDTIYVLNESVNENVVEIKNECKLENLVAQAKYVSANPTTQSLGLLHFTDIHGDQTAADKIVKQAKVLQAYINDILCTGDSVLYYADGNSNYPQGSTWWKKTSGLADRALFVLGNHDGATSDSTEYDQKEDSAAWDGKGKDWCYETYIEPYITQLGYVMPTGYNDPTSPNYHACFWHKDYAAQKIRVIGLDCMHRFDGVVNPTTGEIITAGLKYTTNEQELWLIARLNETLTGSGNAAEGYSVVIACHYPLDDFSGSNEVWDDTVHKFIYNQKETGGRVMSYKTGGAANFHYEETISYNAEVKFNMKNRVDNGYSQSQPYPNYTKGSTNNIGEILKAWKNNGGKFVVWLCGHTHVDFMWYSTKYPDMLCMVLDQAGNLRGTNTGSRPDVLNSRTCANYVAVDTQNGLIKVVRIGYNMNRLMNSHKYLCYDYINKKVLNEG